MSPEEYLKSRVETEIDWYNRKSKINKRAYRSLRVLSALVALSIPVMSGLLQDGNAASLKVTLSIAGAFVALCESLLALYKFHENWTNYRQAAEGLTQHKFLFSTGAAPYSGADAFTLFVQNAENLMAGERIQWLKQNTQIKDATEKGTAEKQDATDNDNPTHTGDINMPSENEGSAPHQPT
ncbi:MAG: DUF4231 domain-containing protein [Bacteroidetes bacterium]|nr:DUF4231 domain-containing protein [Bacteroidota bacterium]MBS1629541.1 DUF4231 domain-containing protein [Bacteroidota bacterium]